MFTIIFMFLRTCVCILVLFRCAAFAQDVQDTTWYGSLPNPDSLDITGDFVKSYSTGWFPQPFKARSTGVIATTNFYEWDRANNIRSASFKPTKYAFSAANPFTGDEDEIKKPNSDKPEDDKFTSEGYSSIGLYYAYNVPFLSCVLRGAAVWEASRTRLYSLDTSRSFLALNGAPQPFREVSVLFSNQHFINLQAGLAIPVYGVFAETEVMTISSYYYIYGGVQAAGRILSENTQYVQIADAKDRIRFPNGRDTVTVMNTIPLQTGNTFRFNADVAFGWRLGWRGVLNFSVEWYATIPLNGVVSDADWRQYRFGMRTTLGYERN